MEKGKGVALEKDKDIVLEKPALDLLQPQKPVRVAVFVRTRSPYFSLTWDEVVEQACSTLRISPTQSNAKLLTVWKLQRLTIFAFDIWNDGYDWATAHHEVDLPVLLVDYGRRLSFVKVGGRDFRDQVNRFVANQHRLHGWDAKPPYFQDQTGPKPPTYMSTRTVTRTLEDGTRVRITKTPPPGSTHA